YTAFAVKHGYTPNQVQAEVAGSHGEAAITMTSGEIATAELEAERITPDRAVELGIDLDDPDNANAYEFDIALAFDAEVPEPTAPVEFVGTVTSGGGVSGHFGSIPLTGCIVQSCSVPGWT